MQHACRSGGRVRNVGGRAVSIGEWLTVWGIDPEPVMRTLADGVQGLMVICLLVLIPILFDMQRDIDGGKY